MEHPATAARDQSVFGMTNQDQARPDIFTTMTATAGTQQIQHALATAVAVAPYKVTTMDARNAFLHKDFRRLRVGTLPPLSVAWGTLPPPSVEAELGTPYNVTWNPLTGQLIWHPEAPNPSEMESDSKATRSV